MADMGLVGMGGAAGAADSIAQLFDQRLKAAQLGQQDALTRLKIQEVADARAETIKQREDVATERAQHQKEVEQDKADQRARMGYPLIPLNSPVSDQTRQTMTQAGIPSEAFQPTPDAVSPDLQPPVSIANDQPAEATVPGTIANSPSPAMRTFQRVPSPAEAETQRKQQAVQQLQGLYPIGSRERALIDYESATGKNAPTSLTTAPGDKFDEFKRQRDYEVAHPIPQTFVAPTVDPQGNNVLRVMPKTLGTEVAARPNAQVEVKAEAKKNALASLDQLDQAIENAKDLIGPGEGRVSNLEQMVGNADPKVQALGTKMLLAKMQVDAGIGGARAAASPQLLARWDNLLANKVTPEGLKAAVQAMREILSVGVTPAKGTKLSAEELIKKYGGGR